MNISDCHFLSDCQQLVYFLNREDITNPPDWRIKPFTQIFANCVTNRQSYLHKIHRSLNSTADSLARQAYSSDTLQFESHCSSVHCGTICSVLQALFNVDLPHVNIIVVSWC
ncbi:hypothetical protein SORBI_3001G004550 [Sorghum bicolor]|uniref:RNase H type-1 domain-containing protein n=1 Tax=Sorghum bicolor TaxID=4558 RepID=A0A1Z5S3S1_SORBI|nr:hypothetical protein SORBI_3001G004550 [Sorghum bicolor]